MSVCVCIGGSKCSICVLLVFASFLYFPCFHCFNWHQHRDRLVLTGEGSKLPSAKAATVVCFSDNNGLSKGEQELKCMHEPRTSSPFLSLFGHLLHCLLDLAVLVNSSVLCRFLSGSFLVYTVFFFACLHCRPQNVSPD